jgi:hypothetical protein
MTTIESWMRSRETARGNAEQPCERRWQGDQSREGDQEIYGRCFSACALITSGDFRRGHSHLSTLPQPKPGVPNNICVDWIALLPPSSPVASIATSHLLATPHVTSCISITLLGLDSTCQRHFFSSWSWVNETHSTPSLLRRKPWA